MYSNYEGENLNDEDLDESIETRIFKEVFLGNDWDTDDNGDLLYEVSQVESCHAIEYLKDNFDHDGMEKRMNLPTEEFSYSGNYSLGSFPTSGPSKRIVSGIYLPTPAVISDSIACHVVESSSQGINSSCFFVKRPAEKDAREIDAIKRSYLISQEISANKLIVEKTIQSPEIHNMTVAKSAWNMEITNNPKPFLRNHIHDLLRDTGWEIGRRKREKSIGEFLYYTPWKRKPIREFRRVWNLCGRKLFTDGKIFLEESNKNWADMTHLWSDLTSTISEIEREINGEKSAAALAKRWYLLDPFVNIVFIDKKLDILKAGKSIKARRSLVMGDFEKNDVLLPSDYLHIYGHQRDEASEDQPSVDSLYDGNALTIFKTKEEGTWCKENSGNKKSKKRESISKSCGTGTTYYDSNLFDVPITYEDADIIYAGSETAPLCHDHNNFSPSFYKIRSDYDEDDNLEAQQQNAVVCFEVGKNFNVQMNDNVGHQVENSYLVDTNIEVMQDLALIEQVDEQSESKNAFSVLGPSFRRRVLGNLEKTSGKRSINFDKNTQLSISCQPEWRDIERENNSLEQLNTEGCCIDASGRTIKYSRKSFIIEQDVKLEKSGSYNKRFKMHSMWQLKGDDVTSSFVRIIKSFRPCIKRNGWKIKSPKSKARKKHKSKKRNCRLVPRSSIRGNKQTEGESPMSNVKTVLSWLIGRGIISLGEDIKCRNIRENILLKEGLITRDGVFCKCCGIFLSVSNFRSHAGFSLINPCLDIFIKSGKSFTTCQIEAWSDEYKARESAIRPVNEYGLDPNDDKCGICGDMGELICCDNCPSTFHQACLETQELPEGSWYCMHCSCRVCGDLVDDKAPQKSHTALMCFQCEKKYHRACLQEWWKVPSDDRFCCQSCQEVYTGLNSRVGAVHQLFDGFSYSLLKCTHFDQINNFAPKVVALEAECNSKLAVALTIMEECFLSIVDSRTGIDMIPHVLYNWRSEYPRLNDNGFYTMVLEKDDMLLSVASIRVHGIAVAEMPLVATSITYQRQGMFRCLLHAIEEMLKCLKVEKLVVSALPSLVKIWTVSFGFTPMDNDERNSLRSFNLMVFPGTVWLKKYICGSTKALQGDAGAGNPSSSVTNSQTERTCRREIPVIKPRNHFFGRSSTNETTNKREMRQINSKKIQMDHDEQQGSLYKHLLKMPWRETDSPVGRIRVDVREARESVLRMSQKAHALQDIC